MTQAPAGMVVETVPIGSVSADPANLRRHPERNVEAIVASLRRFGQQRPIVVDEAGVVRAGNGTLAAAKELGWESIQVVRTTLRDSEATAYAIADNRTAELAAWDEDALKDTLRSLEAEGFDLDAAGWNQYELDGLLGDGRLDGDGGSAGDDPGPQIDRAAELQEKWKTEPGQLWTTPSLATPGREHRLLCGDSTKAGDVARLMGGEKAVLVFTDPPYNQAENRSMKGASELRPNSYGCLSESGWDRGFSFGDAAPSLLSMLAPDCTVMVCMSEFIAPAVWGWMAEWSDYYSYCVWCKPNPMPSLAKRHWTWATELIAYATRGNRTFNFPDDGHALNWWDINVEQADRMHPTQKPPAVPRRAIDYCSLPGDLIGDLFLGSGTTIVAAEQAGRLCYGMELAPKYVAVALERLAGIGLAPSLRAG